MTRVAVVQVEGQAKTWTVIGSDHLPITPVEEYLEFLRLGRYAARTVSRAKVAMTALTFAFLGGALVIFMLLALP